MSAEAPDQFDVLLALARMDGKLDAVLQQQNRHELALQEHRVELSALRDRVVAIESTRKATPPWWVVLGAIVPSVALLMVIAERLYAR